ncbi:MAG TPA: FKBP-type peptidyl-prolyl cis-trans isomerase [Chitinophagaceae bacterium]|nr:FKBP-type peptidyl-prolyl cis-trans isomerase [Chitinophagaceae bacterium]
MLVKKDTIVSLRYVMKGNDGEIIEDTMNEKAVEYLHGGGNVLPSLESALEGLPVGTQKSFTVHDEQLTHPLHFDVVIDEIREATTEEIKSGKPGNEGCGPGCCC